MFSENATKIELCVFSANASMVTAQLDDIAERTAQQNLPGTVDSHPNRRLKAPLTIDELATSDAFT